MTQVHGIIQQCIDAVSDKIADAKRGGEQIAIIQVETFGGGWIIIETNNYDCTVCYAIHPDSSNERECDTLCANILEALPELEEIKVTTKEEINN